jgi:hypothetical protein
LGKVTSSSKSSTSKKTGRSLSLLSGIRKTFLLMLWVSKRVRIFAAFFMSEVSSSEVSAFSNEAAASPFLSLMTNRTGETLMYNMKRNTHQGRWTS